MKFCHISNSNDDFKPGWYKYNSLENSNNKYLDFNKKNENFIKKNSLYCYYYNI